MTTLSALFVITDTDSQLLDDARFDQIVRQQDAENCTEHSGDATEEHVFMTYG
jgi:hypothetical protein